jgi:hypothetical protein
VEEQAIIKIPKGNLNLEKKRRPTLRSNHPTYMNNLYYFVRSRSNFSTDLEYFLKFIHRDRKEADKTLTILPY